MYLMRGIPYWARVEYIFIFKIYMEERSILVCSTSVVGLYGRNG